LKRHSWESADPFWNLPTGLLSEFELHVLQFLSFCEFQSAIQFVDVKSGYAALSAGSFVHKHMMLKE